VAVTVADRRRSVVAPEKKPPSAGASREDRAPAVKDARERRGQDAAAGRQARRERNRVLAMVVGGVAVLRSSLSR